MAALAPGTRKRAGAPAIPVPSYRRLLAGTVTFQTRRLPIVSLRPRVLCAEPSADVCSLLNALLDQNGFDSHSAPTIADSVEKVGAGVYCLCVVDDGYTDGTNV
jgi:hypothetical protein